MIEDVRNVSGSLERFLIDRGETVVRARRGRSRDMIRRIRELTHATKDLYEKIAVLVKPVAP